MPNNKVLKTYKCSFAGWHKSIMIGFKMLCDGILFLENHYLLQKDLGGKATED